MATFVIIIEYSWYFFYSYNEFWRLIPEIGLRSGVNVTELLRCCISCFMRIISELLLSRRSDWLLPCLETPSPTALLTSSPTQSHFSMYTIRLLRSETFQDLNHQSNTIFMESIYLISCQFVYFNFLYEIVYIFNFSFHASPRINETTKSNLFILQPLSSNTLTDETRFFVSPAVDLPGLERTER